MTSSGPSKATIAGLLDIVAGGTGLIGAFVLTTIALVGHGTMRAVPENTTRALAFVPLAFFLPLAGFIILLTLLSIAGGIAALRRCPWWRVVAGLAAAVTIFIPLGVASLIFVILAEHEIRG